MAVADVPRMLALCHSREKSGGCLPGLTTYDVQGPTNHQGIDYSRRILVVSSTGPTPRDMQVLTNHQKNDHYGRILVVVLSEPPRNARKLLSGYGC